MEDDKLRLLIGANISSYRKQLGLTQAGLAEKLNYSDKAVSKWERGESVPDVMTLVQLAEQFHITVNDLLKAPNNPEAQSGNTLQTEKSSVVQSSKRKADKKIILMLSSVLVWFVVLLAFVILSSFGISNSWLAFFYAIPINAIVLLSLRSAWHNFRQNPLLISVIVWGSLLSIHSTIWIFAHVNMWKIYLLGIPGQLAVLLWFRMFPKKENGNIE